jgi:zinc protease
MGVPSALDFTIDNFRVAFSTQLVANDLPQFCPLLADVLRRPRFDPSELEKTKVEWRAKYAEAMNSTRMLAMNRLRQTIYPQNHPFHERPFEEQLAELDAVSLQSIRALHNLLFTPDSTVLSIVGDIEIERAIALVEQSFGDWQKGTPRSIIIPEVASAIKPGRYEINLPDKRSVDVVIGHPSPLKRTDEDFYAARIANAALGQDTITSRLGQIVRDRAGLTYGIYSSFSDAAFGCAPWSVSLSVNPANVNKALSLVSEVLNEYKSHGISEEELDKETGRAIGSFKVGLASSLGIARVLSEFEFLGLGVAELDKIAQRYGAVTKKQADAAMRKYMNPEKAITVVSGTLK